MKLPNAKEFQEFVDEEIEEGITQTEDTIYDYKEILKTLNKQTNCKHEPMFNDRGELQCKHCKYVVIDSNQFRSDDENEFIKFMQSR